MSTVSRVTGTQECVLLGTNLVKAQNTVSYSTINSISGELSEVLKIPAGAIVYNVATQVVTAEGATATAEVGDSTDEDGWIDSIDLNATAGTVALSPVSAPYPALGGKYYETADKITLKIGNMNLDTAKVRVIAHYSMIESV